MTDRFCAIVLAAGSGSRMGNSEKKQFMDLGGHPLIYYSIKAFLDAGIKNIILVTAKEDMEKCREIAREYGFSDLHIIEGGEERCYSVYNGLLEVREEYVLIHDGARAFITKEIILRCMEGAVEKDAVIAALPVKDTIKVRSLNNDTLDEYELIDRTPDRKRLFLAQTPQAFRTELIRDGYKKIIERGEIERLTDDASVLESLGIDVYMVEGDYLNIKITDPADLHLSKGILESLLQYQD